ncbi:hypothetical protein ABZ137_28520 [Streptomyces bobili]|uniref:hypothetical protein n=1 Tax=Streptomyces bobili TaxID=67280 RepID=UPI0033B5D820
MFVATSDRSGECPATSSFRPGDQLGMPGPHGVAVAGVFLGMGGGPSGLRLWARGTGQPHV